MKSALAIALLLALASSAHAQGLGFGSGGSSQPIEITARDGIEWLRDSQRYIARGDAAAKQGDTTVSGDMLTAYYRSQPDGGTEIFRYEAVGKVRISTPTQAAVGDRGVYDVDTGVLVLTGSSLRFTTPTETLTAKDSLEYWENRRSAVARGSAVVVSQDRRMTGDILTAYFLDTPPAARPAPTPAARNAAPAQRNAPAARPAPQPASAQRAQIMSDTGRLQRVEAFGNVHVSTATDIVKADRGVYNAETGIAVMSGNVRITRGEQMLGGEYVEVNLVTGVSRLTTTGDGRVSGVIVPNRADARPAQPAQQPAARTPPPPPARQTEQQQRSR